VPPSSALTEFARSSEQLDSILMARKGDLRETPYRFLLLAIGARERSAVLRLRRNQLRKEVIFENGAAVDCRSNIATESIGRFLVASGRISEEDYRTAIQASAARQVHIEEVLTERKLLSPSELYRALQQNLGRKLLEPFSWTSGQWEISYDVPPATSALRVRIPQLLVTGTMKVEPPHVVEQAIASAADATFAAGADPIFPLDDVRLSDDQRRVLETARERVKLRDLPGRTSVHADEVARIVCALALLGVAFVGEAETLPRPSLELDMSQLPESERIAPPRPVAKAPVVRAEPASPSLPDTPAPPLPQIESAAASEEVIGAYLSFRRKDAFDLLGLEATATPTDVTRAFLNFAERFSPVRFSENAADGLRDKAQEVFLAGARAYAELADPIRREALVQSRARKRANAEAAETEAIGETTASRRQLIDPEALWREGRAQAAKGKLREALSNFELASDCDAQNATYAAEVAWCRFQLMISPAPLALKALKNAIRLDSRCAVAYLYAGRVQKTIGNELEAQAYLDRAHRLMPSLRA
jgi:hypothetical protein